MNVTMMNYKYTSRRSCSSSSVPRCNYVDAATAAVGIALLMLGSSNVMITPWRNVVVVGLNVAVAAEVMTDVLPHAAETSLQQYNVHNVFPNEEEESLFELEASINDVRIWPFARDVDTNNNSTTTSNDKVCYDSTSCDTCNSYHTCHWCAHDSSCHAIGSFYGCMIGSTCNSDSNDDKKKKTPNDDPNDTATGCMAHATCGNCTLSSKLCHWCAHDNTCHAVGSIYGCISGVDCYDNPHCQRSIPEPIDDEHHDDHHSSNNNNNNDPDDTLDLYRRSIGVFPMILIVTISSILVCGITSCCCIMNCLKGAYDDLATSSHTMSQHMNTTTTTDYSNDYNTAPHEEQQPSPHQPSNVDDTFFDCDNTTTTTSTAAAAAAAATTVTVIETGTSTSGVNDEKQPLLETTNDSGYHRMMDGEPPLNEQHSDLQPLVSNGNNEVSHQLNNNNNNARPATRPQQQHQHRRFVAMHRLYVTCMGCYTCTLLLIGVCTYCAIYYFPQKPIYNICNDSVAWKSVMDSVTSFKATAEFQILTSVYNPNPIDIALDMGKGSFSHNGDNVGTYEIPSTLIASRAITDLLIVARLTPEKWQALSITAEYYSGNLVLHVNADVTIRIPALFDYTITTSLQDIAVHVNALSDRRLCACPTWSDNNKNASSSSSYNHHLDQYNFISSL